MTSADFLARFPAAHKLGGHFAHNLTDDQSTVFYRNAAGEVGEACEDRRTTVTRYTLLDPETADMVIDYYTAKRAREARDADLIAWLMPVLAKLSDGGRERLRAAI